MKKTNTKSKGDRRPRVLCVIDTIGLGGGAEQLIASLLLLLRDKDVHVELAALYPELPDMGETLEAHNILVHRFNASGWRNSIRVIIELRSLIRSGGYDVIWSNLRIANLFSRAATLGMRVPKNVVTFHSEGYAQMLKIPLRTKITTAFEKIMLTKSSAKVAVSQAVAADYAQYFGWRDLEVIYNGVDTRKVPVPPSVEERRVHRAKYGVSCDETLIVVPARYVVKKGHIYLLEALHHLQATRGWCPKVVAFGLGPIKDHLIVQALRLGVSEYIQFNDVIPHAELFPLIQSADGVVIPSLREPFGIAAAETMMLNVPIVLTRVDGFKEIVGETGCALMVPPGNATALASAILDLVQDRAAAMSRAEQALKIIANKFDIMIAVNRWVALFERLSFSEH